MAQIKDIIAYFDHVLPKTLSEPWDHDGVMVLPEENREIKRVLISLDATSAVIARAKSISAELIVTHHPLIFNPLSSLEVTDAYGKRVIACIKNNLAVLSYHTRLDEVDGGVCDCLAALTGLEKTEKMFPCGRIGILRNEMSYTEFSEQMKMLLGITSVSGVNSTGRVKKIAVVSGSGKDFVADAKKAGADTFLTGEMNHSSLIEAKELGLNVVCGTHYATENGVLSHIQELLMSKFPDLIIEMMPFMAESEYGI